MESTGQGAQQPATATAASMQYAIMPPESDGPVEWAKFVEELKAPANVQVVLMRFRAEWTATPEKGDRWCACWALTDHEEMAALNRASMSADRAVVELTKQMVKYVDGHRVDWSGNPNNPGSIDMWWNEVGPKCRNLMTRMYTQMHVLGAVELADFFETCVVVTRATAIGSE